MVQELQRLKGRYEGVGDRALARIIFHPLAHRLHHDTVQPLWQELPPAAPPPLPLLDYHRYAERSQARMEVITRSAQGWRKRRISRFLHVSRPTITAWMARFEAEHLESLEDRSRAPQTTVRTAWLPAMVEISHLPKRHPDAGGCRIWSLRGKRDRSVRTVERIMAINRRVSKDIPGTAAQRTSKAEPQPHPFKATAAHEDWCIDGRMRDVAWEGHRWWSLIILDGSARPMRAGAVAPSEARWVALTVLYPACLRDGVPQHGISDRGGACISEALAGVCTRWGIDQVTIVRTEGQSSMHLLETPFHIQRRVSDYQFALTQTPLEFEEAHQHFRELYHTTAQQGLLKEPLASPIPLHVLGEATGRLSTPQERARQCARALFPRITHRYGCVTLHSYHFSVDQGLPQQQVLLWVYGQERRAGCEHALLAAYPCHYDLREGQVTDIRVSQFDPSPCASRQEQGALLERNPLESVVVYRPKSLRRPAALPLQAEQLWLFARVRIG